MPTTNYTFNDLFGFQGEGTSSIDLEAGTPYTFDIANNSGSSYFVMETAQQPNLSVVPKNTSGSYTSLTNIASIVTGDYITGFALPTGTNSFIFTPSINVTGSTLRLRGTGGITLGITGGSSFDPDAQAFITAASITDPTQQSAINTLVIGMKADNLWDNMNAIYPFVGGTATTHKYNLKDPRDLDAAFRLQFFGGITHSNTGALPNGAAYARTFINPSIVLSSTSIHFSNYYRTDYSLSPSNEFGCEVIVNPGEDQYNDGIHTLLPNASNGMFFGNGLLYEDYVVTTNNIGNYIVSRTTSSSNKLFKNGTLLKSNTLPSGNANSEMYLMARKITISPNIDNGARYGRKEIAFCTIGAGLTDTQCTNLNTRIQTFQTTLNRQV